MEHFVKHLLGVSVLAKFAIQIYEDVGQVSRAGAKAGLEYVRMDFLAPRRGLAVYTLPELVEEFRVMHSCQFRRQRRNIRTTTLFINCR